MGVLAFVSEHARPSDWPPINTSGNFSLHLYDLGGYVKVTPKINHSGGRMEGFRLFGLLRAAYKISEP